MKTISKIMMVTMVLVSLLIFTACDKPNTNNNGSVPIVEQPKQGSVVSNILNARVGDFVFDEEGRKYVKITDSDKTNDQGIYRTEVWERIEPLDKKRWYTPALNSFVWTNQPVRFNSLFRMEGEDYPVF